MKLTDEISGLEIRIENLIQETAMQKSYIASLETDNDRLRQALERAQSDRDQTERFATTVATMLERISTSITTTMKELHPVIPQEIEPSPGTQMLRNMQVH